MDALDTLYIMEMYDEFEAATEWVDRNLDFNMVRLKPFILISDDPVDSYPYKYFLAVKFPLNNTTESE